MQRPAAGPAAAIDRAPQRGRRHLPYRLIGLLLTAAVFALVGGRPMTARPDRALAELLADRTADGYSGAGSDPVHLHPAGPTMAEAGGVRLARIRRSTVPAARTRHRGASLRRRRRRQPTRPTGDAAPTTAPMPRRRIRRWRRRLVTFVAVAAGLLLIPAAANAEPTPAPPSPTAPAQAPSSAACGGGEVPADQQRWCFGWVDYTANPPKNSVSHWTTACSRTKTPDELAACQTVSFEFASTPKDGSRATLADVPVGTAPMQEMVGCKQFTLAAAGAAGDGQHGYQESKIWAAMASRCDAIAAALLPALGATVAPPPPKVEQQCDTLDQQCKIDKAVAGAVEHGIDAGIQGVINLIVQGVAILLSKLASQVFTQTSIGAPDDAFYLVYNSTAGIMLIFVFVLFIISAIINTLRFNGGPSPLASVGGLVRAVIGIVFAGGLAWLIVTAWDEATNALLEQNNSTSWDASVWITALTHASSGAGTGALALVAGLFSLVGLLFLFIIMLFRGMLTTAAAVFGAVAMAGQASHETRSWGRRWFWTINALAMSKFAIAALWIYGTRAVYGSDDITTILQAVLIIWLMVFAPGILLRLTAIWDGYLADANGRGFATAAAAGIGDMAGRAIDSFLDGRSGNGGGGGGDAAEVMDNNVTDLDNSSGSDEASTGKQDNGPGDTAKELTQDAGSNESGEEVGAVDDKGGPTGSADDAGSANGEEADAIDDNAAGARADVGTATDDLSKASRTNQDGSNGAPHVPTDPTGQSGAAQTSGSGDPSGASQPEGSPSESATGLDDTAGPPTADSGASGGSADGSGGSPPEPLGEPPGSTDGGSSTGGQGPGGGAPGAGEGAAGAGDAGGAGGAGGSSAAAAAAV